MFDRFTTSARTAVVLAQEEARILDRPQIDTDHLLIALADSGADPAAEALRSAGVTGTALRDAARQRPGDGLDAQALALLGIDLGAVRRAAEDRFGRGALDAPSTRHAPRGHIPFSDGAKKALASAVRHAAALPTGSISGGHLLLGVLADVDSTAVRVLTTCGVDVAHLRADTVALLQGEAA